MINKIIKELMIYSKNNLDLKPQDYNYIYNFLKAELNFDDYKEEIDEEKINSINSINYFVSSFKELGFDNQSIDKIFSIVTERPSVVENKFFSLLSNTTTDSMNYLYNILYKNGYIIDSILDKWTYEDEISEFTFIFSDISYDTSRINNRKILYTLENIESEMSFTPMQALKNEFIVKMETKDFCVSHLLSISNKLSGASIFYNKDNSFYIGSYENLPLIESRDRYLFKNNDDVKISFLDYILPIFKLSSKDEKQILLKENKISSFLLDSINNVDINYISQKINDEYQLYIVFVSNDKKANFKLDNYLYNNYDIISYSGIFILNLKLYSIINLLEELLISSYYSISEYIDKHKELEDYLDIINRLTIKYQRHNSKETASSIVKYEIARMITKDIKKKTLFANDLEGQIKLNELFINMGLEVIK